MKLNITLSTSSIDSAIKKLEEYNKSLDKKAKMLVEKLAEKGIEVARRNSGYGAYIYFGMKLDNTTGGATAIMFGKNVKQLVVQWQTKEGIKSAEVNPILMAEFGSGAEFDDVWGVGLVERGSFPNQTHAFDSKGWYWKDLDGKWHHSDGHNPEQPMYHAYKEMYGVIVNVAKEVFSNE